MNGEDSNMWTLGKRSGEKALNVLVKEYEGQVLINFRHYYKASLVSDKKGSGIDFGRVG